jgi:RNA polymerase sigma factor (sigma-70 family)
LLLLQPDAILCKLSARGSDDAFAALHARYRQQVFAFVFHLLNRPSARDDAEDLTQEIFSNAFTRLSQRKSNGSFKSWLFTIARNRTFDYLRLSKPLPLSLDDPAVAPSSVVGSSVAVEAESRAELAWLVAAVGHLPERQREALVMRELGGLTLEQIALQLHTSPESAKQLIKRGRATVAQSAKDEGYRSKNLGKELAMAAPVVPLAAVGFGVSAGGASAAGLGVFAGGKVAATVLAVVAVGAGSAAVGHSVAAGGDKMPSDNAYAQAADQSRVTGGFTNNGRSFSALDLAFAGSKAQGFGQNVDGAAVDSRGKSAVALVAAKTRHAKQLRARKARRAKRAKRSAAKLAQSGGRPEKSKPSSAGGQPRKTAAPKPHSATTGTVEGDTATTTETVESSPASGTGKSNSGSAGQGKP